VFPEVVAVPGANCVFLASEGPLLIDPVRLSDKIVRLGLETRQVGPGTLPSRLDPDRVAYLAAKLDSPGAKINRDLAPVSYYFHSLLWAGQFRGLESAVLRAAGRIPGFWLLDLPLGLFAFGLVFLAISRPKRSAVRSVIPLAVMGFTSIVIELVLFLTFQAHFGFVYGRIPLLLASFMAGMVLGALAARARKTSGRAELAAVQGGFVLLLILVLVSLPRAGGEAVPFLLLAAFGVLGGYLFVSANRRILNETKHPGLGYGVDLLASFVGVILASSLIIPLFGVAAVILRLIALNVLCFLFLLIPSSARSQ
jgi:spermidine synthase